MSTKVKKDKPAKQAPAPSTPRAEDGAPLSKRAQHPLLALREEVDHLFDSFFSGFALGPFGEFGQGRTVTAPFRRFEDAFAGLAPEMGRLSIKADVRETDDTYVISAELPGLKEEDIEVSVSDGLLTIRGEKHDEKTEDREDHHLTERHYGLVKRSFPVPDTVDLAKAEAHFKNGVLNIALPKKALAKAKAKKIPITGT